jgi:hypothetical protein
MMIESHARAAVNTAAYSPCHVRAYFEGLRSAQGYAGVISGVQNIFQRAGFSGALPK